MIISCEKCNKKFEVDDNLISIKGRLLQCGSCSHQWHYIPENKIELTSEVEITKLTDDVKETKIPLQEFNEETSISEEVKDTKIPLQKFDEETSIDEIEEQPKIKKKKVGFLNYLLAIIVSLLAILILIDTFKLQLSTVIPNIDFYIESFYEILKDIVLFFEDLLK